MPAIIIILDCCSFYVADSQLVHRLFTPSPTLPYPPPPPHSACAPSLGRKFILVWCFVCLNLEFPTPARSVKDGGCGIGGGDWGGLGLAGVEAGLLSVIVRKTKLK